MSGKPFPAWGCVCDLDAGEPLTDCVINEGYWGDCSLAVTSWTKNGKPRIRRSPASCKYWISRASYEGFPDSGQGKP